MNYDNIEVVLDMVIRTFKLREWQYDIEDWVEDVAEALRFIGASSVYEEAILDVEVNNFAAKIPIDCIAIKYVDEPSKPWKKSGSFIQVDDVDGTMVQIVYTKMPVDVRGYPLVPDNEVVRKAIMWYIVCNLVLQGEIKTINYQLADKKWNWYCGSARADLNSPSLNSWAGTARDFRRLNPSKDQHSLNYTGVGKRNSINRDGKRQDIR